MTFRSAAYARPPYPSLRLLSQAEPSIHRQLNGGACGDFRGRYHSRPQLESDCRLALGAGASTYARSAVARAAAGIEHIAHASFRITSTGGRTILIDPYASRIWIGYDFPVAAVDADAVLISHPHYDHDTGIYRGAQPPWGASMPVWREPGTYQVDGLRIVHVGDNGPIDDRIAAQLGQVDLLMLPIDSAFHILSQVEIDEYLARLRPRLLIPMHYRHPDLEPQAGEPRGLGGIDDWLRLHAEGMTLHRPRSHRINLSTGQLHSMAGVLVLEHSPDIAPASPEPGERSFQTE